MTSPLQYASNILASYEKVATDLTGKTVVLSDGKAGTVERIWLDELHGFRISIFGHFGKWPISSLKFIEVLPTEATEAPATTNTPASG
jgi:hypothetical protein